MENVDEFLEHIEGETLQRTDVIELSNPEKVHIIDQLINAVQVAHENSIIHRDINPKNIMVTRDKQVKLIDFGISKIKDMVNTDTLYQFATNKYAAQKFINIVKMLLKRVIYIHWERYFILFLLAKSLNCG